MEPDLGSLPKTVSVEWTVKGFNVRINAGPLPQVVPGMTKMALHADLFELNEDAAISGSSNMPAGNGSSALDGVFVFDLNDICLRV